MAVGDPVLARHTILGLVGTTGAASGCHTHFEIRWFSHRFLRDDGWNSPFNIYGKGDQPDQNRFRWNWVDPFIPWLAHHLQWTAIVPGVQKDGLEFGSRGPILVDGAVAGSCGVRAGSSLQSSRLLVSQPSPQGTLVLVICWDTDVGGYDAHVLDNRSRRLIASHVIPGRWRTTNWASWSSDDDHLLIMAAGEVTMGDMAVVDLLTGRTREIHFQDLTGNWGNRQDRLQDIDPETVEWETPLVCGGALTVHCNPYEPGGDQCDCEVVLRRLRVRVNVENLAITCFKER